MTKYLEAKEIEEFDMSIESWLQDKEEDLNSSNAYSESLGFAY